MTLLHHQFVITAKKYRRKTAIIDKTTGLELSYSKALIGSLILAKKVKRLAAPGFIGVMMPTSAGCALTVLGALMSGRVPVMINYSTGAAENAEYAQAKCGFKTIITSRALVEKIGCRPVDGMVFIEDLTAQASGLDKLRAAARAALPAAGLLRTIHDGDLDDTAIILLTSGSEKEPKAVPLSHRNIAANIEALVPMLGLSDSDRMLASLPYFHVFGQTANLWVPLLVGMTMVTYANPLDFAAIPRIVRQEEVTLMVGTPSFFWGYLRKSEPGDFRSIRIALVGADKCPDSLREAFRTQHDLVLYEAYGATETSPAISANTPEANRPGSVGKVLPNLELKIEDLESGEEAPVGVIGKILVKGDSVMRGYLGDMEETSLRLRRGWYDTGDMGYLDEDGYLWHAGRLKRFVKVGGEMVSLVRVEDELMKLLPEGVGCCVVGIPDPVKGSKIVAAVTGLVDQPGLTKSLAGRLPNIAVPNQFIVLEELPTMGSGKVDFRAVAVLAADSLSPVS